MLRMTLAAAAILAATTTAQAQGSLCGDRATLIERLETQYGETRQGLGVGRENGVVEVYVNSATGSWTILMTLPTGVACLMAAGEAWQGELRQAAKAPERPA